MRSWVQASCRAQGVPETVSDPATVRRVVALLSSSSAGIGAQARSASTDPALLASDAPDGLHAVDVEPVTGSGCRLDDDTIHNSGDDGGLPS